MIGLRVKYRLRIVPIFAVCLVIVSVVGIVLGAQGLIFGNQLLSIYTSDPEVAAYGMGRMKVIFPTYFFDGLMDTACGSIRGLGYSLLPTLVTLTGVCLFRIIWIMTVYRLYPTLFTLYLSYPITWIITFIAHVICFIVLYRKYRKNG